MNYIYVGTSGTCKRLLRLCRVRSHQLTTTTRTNFVKPERDGNGKGLTSIYKNKKSGKKKLIE